MEGKNTDIYTSLPYTLYVCMYFIDHKHISRSDTRRWLSLIYIPSTSIHTSVNFFANQYFRFIRLTHHTIMNLSILPKRGTVWSPRYGNTHQILMIRDYRDQKINVFCYELFMKGKGIEGISRTTHKRTYCFIAPRDMQFSISKNLLLHVQINRFWKLKDNSCIFCLYSKIISSLYQNVSHHEIISIQ